MAKKEKSTLADTVHPEYLFSYDDWEKYRFIMNGGDAFVEEYLIKFNARETDSDFTNRKQITPIPGFSAGAIIDIKNAIYQRMSDVTRENGSENYQAVITGKYGGVDLKSGTMHHFIGQDVLPELLFMGKVGIFVDMPDLSNFRTKLETEELHPYFYIYKAENIRNWVLTYPENGVEFTKLLLRETNIVSDSEFDLPYKIEYRYRLITNEDGVILVKFYNENGKQIDANNEPTTEATELKLKSIPFVLLELQRPLLKDIANHQIALMNMESSDVNYSLKANFPFYVEQSDNKTNASYLKNNEFEDGTSVIDIGVVQGRKYGDGLDRPAFIHPSSEPLEASRGKQKDLKDDIRQLVNLALSTIRPKFASAEAKQFDERGLESGLSFLGLILEQGERQIAKLFSDYENSKDVPGIHYPERYDLETDKQKTERVSTLTDLISKLPSNTAQKSLTKQVVRILLESKVKPEEFQKIITEIEEAKYTTSDPEIIHSDIEKNLVSLETASLARGYTRGEVSKAKQDHAERLALIEQAQTKKEDRDSGAAGIKDKQINTNASKEEKTESQNPDLNNAGKKLVRGKAKIE